jgi:hypothetical protein
MFSTRRWTLRACLTAGVALRVAGCADTSGPGGGDPLCVASPAALDFGQVEIGQGLEATFQLSNAGGAEARGTVGPPTCPEVQIVAGGGSYALGPGQAMTVTARFTPVSAGAVSCSIPVGEGCPEVACQGEGASPTPGAQCSVTPGAIDFGSVEVGQLAERSYSLKNVGPVSFDGYVVETCADFQVIQGAGSFALAPGDSVAVTVRFAPSVAGSAACTIRNGVNCPEVAATGVATAPAVSFGQQIQPLFDVSCATAGCHRPPSPKGNLVLLSGQSHANLVGVVSDGYAPAIRVVPGDPGTSVLYHKVANTGAFGGGMPPGGGLSAADVERIGQWILQGAPDN